MCCQMDAARAEPTRPGGGAGRKISSEDKKQRSVYQPQGTLHTEDAVKRTVVALMPHVLTRRIVAFATAGNNLARHT